MLAWLVLVLMVLGSLFVLLGGVDITAATGNETPYLAVAAAVLGLYLIWLLAGYRGRAGQAALHLAAWLLIGLGLVACYAYRDEVMSVAARVGSELLPSGQTVSVQSSQPGHAAVRMRRRYDGHFVARAAVNGQTMTMLIDTGASSVVLKPSDAARAGIDTRALRFTVPVQTANGMTFAAPVRLRSIVIGTIEVRNVPALVAKRGGLEESLLGMSFLGRLRSYEFSGDFLTLRG